MSSKEELRELKESKEIVEIKNRVGEKFEGLIVSVTGDSVIYKGLKRTPDEKQYQEDESRHTMVITGEDLISDIQITKLPEEIKRRRTRASIDIIERNKEKEKRKKN